VINLWQLQVFLVVYETGSFSAAATRLHLTQPGVSQQIRALENYLNTKLFVRRGHGVELTAAGESLIDPARRLITLSETTERTLIAKRGEVSGRIRLGCALPSGSYIFTPWIQDFRTMYPDITVQIEQVEPGPLLGALRSQELDGGVVMGRMRGRGLVHHKLLEDPITLIVPINHAWAFPGQLHKAATEAAHNSHGTGQDGLAARHDEDTWVPAVKLGMLKDQALVLEHGIGESHSDARRALNDGLEERGFNTRDMRVVLELPNPMAVACAVANGAGVGLVPQSIARRLTGQVAPVRIEGFNLSQHIYLIHDRKALHAPAVGAWWNYIQSKLGQHKPTSEQEEEIEPAETVKPRGKDASAKVHAAGVLTG
jgi:DNA-binding transcriptional LysR family regulator